MVDIKEFLRDFDSLKEALASARDEAGERSIRDISCGISRYASVEELLDSIMELSFVLLESDRRVFRRRTREASMKEDPTWPLIGNQPDRLVMRRFRLEETLGASLPLKEWMWPVMVLLEGVRKRVKMLRSQVEIAGDSISRGTEVVNHRLKEYLKAFASHEARFSHRLIDRRRFFEVGAALLPRILLAEEKNSRKPGGNGQRKSDAQKRRDRFYYYRRRAS